MRKIQVINGPNLNLLGTREPEVYGDLTLENIRDYTSKKLEGHDVEISWFQSNLEGEIINKIHEILNGGFAGLVINPGGYSHTSVAILDALKILDIPIVEVHLSNTHSREDFRQTKLTAKASKIIMEGLGKDAYFIGIYSLIHNEEK